VLGIFERYVINYGHVTRVTPECPAFADLLAEQVLWQARAALRRQAKRRTSACRYGHDKKEEVSMATPVTVPMVGKIVSVSVKVGDKVKEDDQMAVLEAMKMEMPLVAPVSGVVKEICVSAGQEVEAEATIAVIE
jgi:biotin carboxyl carrier protein